MTEWFGDGLDGWRMDGSPTSDASKVYGQGPASPDGEPFHLITDRTRAGQEEPETILTTPRVRVETVALDILAGPCIVSRYSAVHHIATATCMTPALCRARLVSALEAGSSSKSTI